MTDNAKDRPSHFVTACPVLFIVLFGRFLFQLDIIHFAAGGAGHDIDDPDESRFIKIRKIALDQGSDARDQILLGFGGVGVCFAGWSSPFGW